MPSAFFPTEFAQSILSLKQKRIEQEAQLEEMRRARKSQEEIEKARASAQSVASFWQAHAAEKQAKVAEAAIEAEKEQFAADLQFKYDNLREARKAAQEKALNDLAIHGSAFIPAAATGEYTKLLNSLRKADDNGEGSEFAEIPIPGMGLMVTRLDGENALEHQKLLADINKTLQSTAVDAARTRYYDARAAREEKRSQGLIDNISHSDGRTIQSAIQMMFDSAMRKAATLKVGKTADERKQAAMIEQDWRNAYKGTDDYDRIGQWQTILDRYLQSNTQVVDQLGRSNPEVLARSGYAESVADAHVFTQTGAAGATDVRREPASPVSAQAAPTAPGPTRVTGHVWGADVDEEKWILSDGRVINPSDIKGAEDVIRSARDGDIPTDDPAFLEAAALYRAIGTWQQKRAANISIYATDE